MKRYEALMPLSREHHQTLILARLLRKDAPLYPGLPSSLSGKAEYALAEYHSQIQPHFKKEERIFTLLSGLHKQIDILTAALTGEHRQIESYFHAINTSTPDPDRMDELGRMLEKHIRQEERVLFPLIQECCPEKILEEIRLSL